MIPSMGTDPDNPAYGPLRDAAELEAVIALQSVAFNLSLDYCRAWSDDCGHDRIRAFRAGGEVVGCAAVHPFGQWFGGRCVPMGGIGAVGISPEERGSGAAAALMAGTVRDLRENGVPLSALYASTQTLYRTAGYERAGSYLRLGCPANS